MHLPLSVSDTNDEISSSDEIIVKTGPSKLKSIVIPVQNKGMYSVHNIACILYIALHAGYPPHSPRLSV